jgi:hypothetical protein
MVQRKKAAKFLPTANTKYAFVYTKTASTTTTPMYEPRAFSGTGTKYRYKITAVAAAGDVQKNVVYVKPTTGIGSVFLGQGAGNLYTDNSGTAATTEYASTGTSYFYKDGSTYKAAHTVAYADFAGATLYVKSGAYYVAKTETEPVNGTAYYYKDETNPADVKYVYCVIYPERTTTEWFTVDTNNYEVVGSSDTEIPGMTYFDMYSRNNGVYYTKVIKVE